MKIGQQEKAFEEIRHATTLDSNYATAWQYRGRIGDGAAQLLAGVESLSRALSLNQTVDALEKREACYRIVGWTMQSGGRSANAGGTDRAAK